MPVRIRRKRKPPAGPDCGTPEAQARKRELVGDGDPALAGYPITQDQHDAGRHYAYLAGRVLGRTRPYRPDSGSGGSTELGEGALEAVEDRWREAAAALLAAGRRAKDAVDNAALFERLPVAAELGALTAGLDALALWRRGRRPLFAEAAE